jgi:hypothetical protein
LEASAVLDIFASNIFGVVALTDAITNLPFKPGRVGELGIFSTGSVPVTTIVIEERDGQLVLIPPTPRGGPGTTVQRLRRRARNLTIPHFEINDAIMAEEVQGVRAFGTESQLETVMDKVLEHGELHVNSFDVTEEYHRLGAIKGLVTYADGTTLNLYTEFNVAKLAPVNFDLKNTSYPMGRLRQFVSNLVRTIGTELGGLPFTRLWALCGDDFFDALIGHQEVRQTFLNWTEAQILRDGYVGPNASTWGSFSFGGVVFENYRGFVGGTHFIEPDECYIFPLGVPNLFRTVYGPADYLETVNTMGRRLYAKQYPMENDKGVNFDVQTNALQYCTRPRVLLTGTLNSDLPD